MSSLFTSEAQAELNEIIARIRTKTATDQDIARMREITTEQLGELIAPQVKRAPHHQRRAK